MLTSCLEPCSHNKDTLDFASFFYDPAVSVGRFQVHEIFSFVSEDFVVHAGSTNLPGGKVLVAFSLLAVFSSPFLAAACSLHRTSSCLLPASCTAKDCGMAIKVHISFFFKHKSFTKAKLKCINNTG